ncbi:MAG: hypothetical protein WC364_04870 [Eubacteriales bacterium]|jgi:hypothetical protein
MGLTRVSKKAAFLAAYSELGNITRAALASNVARTKHYTWLKDPAYAQAFAEAEEIAIETLEVEARRRAIEGLKRKKFNKNGLPVMDPETKEQYFEHEYSDTLLIFLLKAARPEKYKDRISQEIGGPGGGPVEVHHKYDKLSDEELDRLIEEKVCEIAKIGGTDPS